MKKLLSIVALVTLSLFTFFSLRCMEAREKASYYSDKGPKEPDYLLYQIICKDNEILEVDKEKFNIFAKHSITITDLLEDDDRQELEDSHQIPLEQLYHSTIKELLEFSQKSETINNLSKKELLNLITLINSVNYLNMPQLLELLIKTVAHKVIVETTPQRSWVPEIFSKKETKAEKIIEWLKQNKNELQQLPPELLNKIAIHTIKYSIPFTNLMLPPEEFHHYDNFISCLAWNPDGSILASGCDDKTIRLWQKNSDNKWIPIIIPSGHTDTIQYLAWNTEGTMFASATNFEPIRIWRKTTDGQWLSTILTCNAHYKICCLEWHKSDLRTFCDDFIFRIWKQKLDKWTQDEGNFNFLNIADVKCKCAAFNEHQSQRAFGFSSGRIIFMDKSKIKFRNPLQESVSSLAWNSDGSLLASTYKSKKIGLWEKNSHNKLTSTLLHEHPEKIRSLAWSPDGTTLASGSSEIRLWQKNSGNMRISTMPVHPINCLAWNPDGSILASGSDTIRLWKKISYETFSFKQALLLLILNQAKTNTIPFEIPRELQDEFDQMPKILQNFLTNKNQ